MLEGKTLKKTVECGVVGTVFGHQVLNIRYQIELGDVDPRYIDFAAQVTGLLVVKKWCDQRGIGFDASGRRMTAPMTGIPFVSAEEAPSGASVPVHLIGKWEILGRGASSSQRHLCS